MKPRAGDSRSATPRSAALRLEVSTTTGGDSLARELGRDLEAGDVGEEDVEQHRLRAQPPRRLDRRGAVLRLAHDREPELLEQAAREPPERRVIVDDQHRRWHVRIVTDARGAVSSGFP